MPSRCRETMTVETKKGERLPLEMTEDKKKNYAGIIRRVYGRGMIFWDLRRTRIHRWYRVARDGKSERPGGSARAVRGNERERGIITTITLPPRDRFREEEKGEEEDGEEDDEKDEEEDVEMVWWSRTRQKYRAEGRKTEM